MTSDSKTRSFQEAALQHLWMHNADWTQVGEEGGPPIIIDGQGIRVTDSDGNSWIDVGGGYCSVNVGYGRSEIASAAYEQMLKMPYFPVGTTTPPTAMLAKKIAEIAPGNLSRVFPVSGGSEANETAVKIVRAYHRRNGDSGRYKIISRKGSYHGATGGVLWFGGGPKRKSDYEPMTQGMVYAPQPNPYRCELGGKSVSECAVKCGQAIEDLILFHGPETVAGVIAEPVSMAEGTVIPGDEYWPMVREICDKYGVLLIADEVICGFGRTGKMFAVDHWNIVPDILTLAKGIVSSYMPMGAAVATTEVANRFTGKDNYFQHVFTSSGHPVAAAASLKNIEIIESESLVQNASQVGAYLKEQLEGLMTDHPTIGDVRGLGLLTSIELVSNRKKKTKFPPDFDLSAHLNPKFRDHGLILRVNGSVINVCPPLCVTLGEVDEISHAIDLSLWELEGELGISKMT